MSVIDCISEYMTLKTKQNQRHFNSYLIQKAGMALERIQTQPHQAPLCWLEFLHWYVSRSIFYWMTKIKESYKKTGLLPWTKPFSWTHNSYHCAWSGRGPEQSPTSRKDFKLWAELAEQCLTWKIQQTKSSKIGFIKMK